MSYSSFSHADISQIREDVLASRRRIKQRLRRERIKEKLWRKYLRDHYVNKTKLLSTRAQLAELLFNRIPSWKVTEVGKQHARNRLHHLNRASPAVSNA